MLGRLRRSIRFVAEAESAYAAAPRRTGASLARDVLLLTLDPETGRRRGPPTAGLLVCGALLVELAREERIAATGEGRKVRVAVLDASPLGDPDLDDALLSVACGLFGSKATRLLQVVSSDVEVLERLVADGLVDLEERRRFGVTVRRYRPTPAAHWDELAVRVRSALLGEAVPDERTALLVALLASGAPLRRWVPRSDVAAAHRQAEQVFQGLGEQERALVSAFRAAAASATSD